MTQLTFREQLEAAGDERDVRDRIARGLYHSQNLGVAKEWLRGLEEARAREAEARRESREGAALEIARENVTLVKISADAAADSARAARSQASWAKWAAGIAIVAAVVSIKDGLRDLFSLLP